MGLSSIVCGTDFQPDSVNETALIKVVFDGKQFTMLTGDALPALKVGAKLTLRALLRDFTDKDQANVYSSKIDVELLPARTRLFAMVKDTSHLKYYDDRVLDDMDYASKLLDKMTQSGFIGDFPKQALGAVEVILIDPLKISLRGDKKPTLKYCVCAIPYFKDERIENSAISTSLNHAFTRISERFEPNRISHTGNAFTRFYVEDGDGFERLDEIVEQLVHAHRMVKV